MSLHKNIGYISFLPLFLLVWLATACSADGIITESEAYSPVFKVGAQIMPVNQTRAYQASGIVNEGTYYITYKNSNSEDDFATVEFLNGTGTILKGSKQLEWTDIGYNDSESISTFYLDNVSGENQTSDCTVSLDDSTPFVAGIFDDEEGSNDLLWAQREISRNSPVVNFQLNHCMARINVEVTLDNSLEDEPFKELDLEKDAIVKITSLVHTPIKYERLTGNLVLPENPEYKELVMVNTSEDLNWKSIEGTDDKETVIYNTLDFVLPPQELLTNEDRPRLSITVPVGGEMKTFSGLIPRVMEMLTPDGSIIPMTLSLLRGHVITLHVRLSPDPLEIIFMPVTVQDWVNKGTFLLGVNQAGLDSENDLENFILAVNSGEEKEISKFGYKNSDGIWVFNIFCDMTFQESDISGIFKDTEIGNFTFAMHGWTVTVVGENDEIICEIGKAVDLVNFLKFGTLPSQNSNSNVD